jgi:hypothetical protein
MNLIGFPYNYSLETNRERRKSPSLLNRVALLDKELRPAGFRIFLYSPGDVVPTRDTVRGCIFEGTEFTPIRERIPTVNGNWTHRTRRLLEAGMGYQEFNQWAADRGIGIYVPHAFSELMANKLETYKLVRGFHETLHPHCEPFMDSERQLGHFADTGPISFIKPRTGSKGDRIVTLRRDRNGVSVTRYHKGQRRTLRADDLAHAREIIREAIEGKSARYVIQHGVETMRHDGATFDIRVTMLNDGRGWHWLHEARLSPSGSDVSNISQGGATVATEDLLFEVVGTEASQDLLYELRNESFGLAAYIERLHPGEIHEVAFDFAVDREGRLRLLEVNTKPGLAGVGASISVLDKKPEDEPAFERWVYPHARHLARFLMAKAVTAPVA